MGLLIFAATILRVLIEAKNLVAKLAAYPEHGLNRIKTVMRDAQGLGADYWFDRFTSADPVKERTKPSRVISLRYSRIGLHNLRSVLTTPISATGYKDLRFP